MTVMRLDRLPDGAPDGPASGWSAHVVLRDGSVVTHRVTSFDRAGARVTLSSDLDSVRLAGAMCVLENATAPSTQWRVLSVREIDGLRRAFQARQYDPGRYAAVETGLKLAAPAPDSGSGPLPAPASVSLRERLYEDGGATKSALAVGIEEPAGGRDTRVAGIDVQIRRTAGDDTGYRPLAYVEAGFAELSNARPGGYRARARYVAGNGALRGPWTESAEFTAAGFAAPAVPAGVSLTAVAGGYAVSWDTPAERDYAYTEILERSGQGAAEAVGRSAASPWPRLGLDTAERHVSVRHVDRTGRKTAASAESAVTPEELDVQAAQTAAAEAADSATTAADSAGEVDRAVAGLPAAVATAVDGHLDTELANAVALRAKTGDAARLEPASLSDLDGTASTAKIDAGALSLGTDFEVADGRLGIADTALNIVPLWGGSKDIPANGAIVSVGLSADMRAYGVINGTAIAGASPYAAVRIALIVPGAVAGTASARPADARKFGVVLNAASAAEVYYWRSADGRTLYLQNDTAAGTPPAVRLLSLLGARNPGVPAPRDLVVSPLSLDVDEGGTATFTVRLWSRPTGDVTVQVSETDSDISLDSTSLTFTTDNWHTDQTVTVSGLQDSGTSDDTAVVELIASGGGYTATATVNVDIEDLAPCLVLSDTSLSIREGGSDTFTVKLTRRPTSTVTVALSESDPDISISPTRLTFTTSNWNTAQTVTVNGLSTGSASITLSTCGGGLTCTDEVSVQVTRHILTANIAAVGSVDEGDETVHTVAVGGTAIGTITYAWSVVGDGTIVGSPSGSTCRVRADEVEAGGGDYTVSVDIERGGLDASDSEAVNVNDVPDTLTVVIDAVGSVDEGDETVHTVAVGGTAIGTITYAWSVVGDGTIVGSPSGSTCRVRADEVEAGGGDYTVSVDIERGGLDASDSEAVNVNDVPDTLTVVIDAVGSVDEGDETVHTVAVGGTAIGTITYAWSVVGDGTIVGSPSGSTCRVRADEVEAGGGDYTVSVDIERGGLDASDSEAVNVNDVPDTLTVVIDAVGSVDEGDETVHTVAVGGTAIGTITYAWSVVGDGTIVGSPSGSTCRVRADEVEAGGGDYTVSVDIERGGLDASDSEAVNVNDVPDTLTADIAAVGSVDEGDSTVHTVAVGGTATGAITYAWSVADDGTIVGSDSGASVTVRANEVDAGGGDYTVSVDIMRGGLDASDSEAVTVNNVVVVPDTLTADIAAVGSVDEGDSTVHTVAVGGTATGAITYAWSVADDGTIVGSDSGASVTVRANEVDAGGGDYTVSVDIERGGLDADDSEAVDVNDVVVVPDTLTAEIAAVGSVDEGDSTVHTVAVGGTATGAITYAWSVAGDGTIVGSTMGASVTVRANEVSAGGGDYTVSVDIERGGLDADDSEAVDVNDVVVIPDTLTADIAAVGSVDEGDSTVHTVVVGGTATGGISYAWSVAGDGTIVGSASSPTVTVRANQVDAGGGDYTVSVDIGRGELDASDSESVNVDNVVVVPDTLTVEIAAVGSVDEGDSTVHTLALGGTVTGAIIYAWGVVGDGTILGSTSGSTCRVRADEVDAGGGNYTVIVNVSRGGLNASDDENVDVDDVGVHLPSGISGLVATSGEDEEVPLSWNDPDDSSLTAIRYRVKESSSSVWGAWTNMPSTSLVSHSYTVTGLINDTSYDLQVAAVNSAGQGPSGSGRSATPQASATIVTLTLMGDAIAFEADSFGPGLDYAAGHTLNGSWSIPSELGFGTITSVSIDDDGLVWLFDGAFSSGTTLTVNGISAGAVRNNQVALAQGGGYVYVWTGGAGIANVSAGNPSTLTFTFSRQV